MLSAGITGGLYYSLMKKIGLGPKMEGNDWLNNPNAIQLRHELKKRNFDKVENSLDGAQANNIDLYTLLIAALSQFSGNPTFINEYVRKHPGSDHACIIAGSNQKHWAWEARTGVQADEVSDKQWELFFERLNQANKLLSQALDINSSNPEAYSDLIQVSMGMGVAQKELFSIFSSLKMNKPNHVIGHSHMLYALTDKWGGSDETMFSFARNTFSQSLAGSPLGVLIAQAHIEKWSDITIFDEDSKGANAYISNPAVQEELLKAYNHSVNHMDYRYGALAPMYTGIFAMAFYLCGNFKLARINCAKLAKGFSQYPWYYLNETEHESLNAGYVLERIIKHLRVP